MRQDDVRAIVHGKERAMNVPRKRERVTPVACPHCSKEITASHATLGDAGKGLREKITMTCPHCGQEFSVALDPGDALMSYGVACDAPADDDADV
jgi:transcription elongation factor Elf1